MASKQQQTEEQLDLHPSVLEVELEHHMEWAAACWSDPGAGELREQMAQLLRTAFLAEYSKPPSEVVLEHDVDAAQLLVFDELSEESEEVLEGFGYESVTFVPDQYKERMSAWRQEAERLGRPTPDEPASVWKVTFERPAKPIDEMLDKIQRQMVAKLDEEVWGATPGGPSRLMATYLRQHFNTTVTPNEEGLNALQVLLVQETTGKLRAMRPMVFQALCDFIGVVLQAEHDVQVQWAMCKPASSGLAPPPVFRVQRDEGHHHIPIGELVIDWCVMPRSDDAPTLVERVRRVAEDV